MKSTVGRTQSIRYIGDDGDDDAPILKFASLDRGGLDDENDENDEKKKKKSFYFKKLIKCLQNKFYVKIKTSGFK